MGKGKKKGWKRVPREADENIHDVNLKRHISNLPDEEMFVIDTTALPLEDEKPAELTFKQKAALKHKLCKSALKDEDVDMKDLELKTFPRVAFSSETIKTRSNKLDQASTKYDLWEEDNTKPAESTSNDFEAVGIEHYDKVLQRKRRKAPKATRFVPNIIPAVEIPKEGASYNPTLDSYVAYANQIVQEELKMEKAEKKINKNLPAKNVSNVGPGAEFEDFRSLLNRDEEEDASDDENPISTNVSSKTARTKPKTIKQKKLALLRKIQSLQKDKESMSKKQLQEFSNLKKTLRDVRKEEDEHKAKIAARKQQKVLDSLTKRKKLGRGEFKAYEEPVLLTEELTGNLRQLPSRGNILEERFKSLQKRNILPIAGERKKSNRKTTFKVKFVEKRSVKEVTKGSRVL
uniref:Ribosome biogenesis protein NOP53 n=1 Tax=Acrobeloides nanus TaxID=290746 RepID=A0A914E4F8_9BILA